MELLPLDALQPEVPATRRPVQKRTRSRLGCFSCKKLKIKCDEARPACEYCLHTSRLCVYPVDCAPDTPVARQLNSMQTQMCITRFEQKLLKFYLDFGGAFFTGNKSPVVKRIFEVDAPRLWQQSALMRSAIYACSTVYLWRFYHLGHISNVYLSEDQYLVLHNNNDRNACSLLDMTDRYVRTTLRLLRDGISRVTAFSDLDSVGAVILGNVFLFAVVSIHPVAGTVSSNDDLFDIFDVSHGIFNVAEARADIIDGSKYETLLYRDELAIKAPQPTMFPFITNLRKYLINVVTGFDGNFDTYHHAVDEIDHTCYRAVKIGYVLPILRGVMELSKSGGFIQLIKSRDYIAMKILYTFCCVISICGIKMFSTSIWDSYVEEFRTNTHLMFGGFEDAFDGMLYHQVMKAGANKNKRKSPFLHTDRLIYIGTTEL